MQASHVHTLPLTELDSPAGTAEPKFMSDKNGNDVEFTVNSSWSCEKYTIHSDVKEVWEFSVIKATSGTHPLNMTIYESIADASCRLVVKIQGETGTNFRKLWKSQVMW